MTIEPVLVGVIGGSGVYGLKCLENAISVKIDTPFGSPSDELCIATVRGVRCAFLPRHGRGHTFTPSEVNYQANIWALKSVGVKYILSITAVGSLDEDYKPGDLVLPDQLVDKTIHRKSTFFGNGIVGHVPLGFPMTPELIEIAYTAMKEALPEAKIHKGGALVTMEGPAFSTKAESKLNKAQGFHMIGMTTSTEAKLAREAEIAYVVVSMVTDTDAWSDEPHVDVSTVMKTLHDNAEKAQIYPPAVIEAIGKADATFDCEAFHALQWAVMTKPELIPADRKIALAPLLKKYPQFA
jgi:5'-methylthioadenosine phosphorylase